MTRPCLRTWSRPLLGALALLLAPAAGAQDNPALGGDGPPAGASASAEARGVSASRSSPFDPPGQSDRLFIADDGPGLDTGCTFRSGGPLRFEIPVTRYVGPVFTSGAGGPLVAPGDLVAAGVVSATATLTLPVYDVDSRAAHPEYAPEVDRVVFNGHDVGTLDGNNNQWNLNAFEVPIEHVRFPHPRAGGPAPAVNVVEVHIDQANSEQVWCVGLDWGSLEFKATSPVFLVHGVGNNPGFWNRMGFSSALRRAGLPFEGCGRSQCLFEIAPRFSYRAAGRALGARFAEVAEAYGVDSYHVVGHSKGGLDTRSFLGGDTYDPERGPQLLSLITLDTPHDGSVVADVLFAYDAELDEGAVSVEFEGFPSFTDAVIPLTYTARGGDADDLFQLTTDQVGSFNDDNVGGLPRGVRYIAIGADADRNGNGELDFFNGEASSLISESLGGGLLGQVLDAFNGGADNAYQILRRVASVTVDREVRDVVIPGAHPVVIEDAQVSVLRAVPTPSPEGNDSVVTVSSALGRAGGFAGRATRRIVLDGSEAKNHATIGDEDVARVVIPLILAVERAIGDLR